jgi:hypothetical protein
VRTVKAQVEVPGRIFEAEQLWYDTARWPAFVDGLHHVDRQDPGWPHEPGARLVWTSTPGGRGRVAEEVERFEARAGQTCRVEDEAIRGQQAIAFAAAGQRTRITLTLTYELKAAGPIGPLTDLLFIRRAQRDALARTLARFARELRSDREPPV